VADADPLRGAGVGAGQGSMSDTPNIFGDGWDATDDWSGGGAKS
jgi:hypothetical protein